MKFKILLLLAVCLSFTQLKGQIYQIHSVEPDTLITGDNTITITLDKKLVDYDSITIFVDGSSSFTGECNPDSTSFVDSVITAKITIPYRTSSQNAELSMTLINTTDWSFEKHDSAIYIKEVLYHPTYNIKDVQPDYLIPGSINTIEITLDKEISENDSAYLFIKGYVNGVYTHDFYPYYNSVTDRMEYSWTDSTITASFDIPELSQNEKGVLHLEMINKFDLSNQNLVYDDSILVGGNIYSIKPEICMVSVDSSNKNMIIWEPDYDEYVDSIIIYKETAVTDEFLEIGRKAIEETPVFVDEESENSPNSNRYTIAFQDTSGVVSKMSLPHKTLHLTMNVGVNHTINLIWEEYEGFDYPTFHIYRGSTKGGMLKIAEVASNLFTFSDLSPSFHDHYYQIVIDKPAPCDITIDKSTESTYSSTKSNIVEHSMVSTSSPERTEFLIHIYPNPATNNITISIDNLPNNEFDVVIHDLTGRSVQSYHSLRNGSNIDLSELKSGMYLLSVTSEGMNKNKIIIKE
jgi:hypothetical protein